MTKYNDGVSVEKMETAQMIAITVKRSQQKRAGKWKIKSEINYLVKMEASFGCVAKVETRPFL